LASFGIFGGLEYERLTTLADPPITHGQLTKLVVNAAHYLLITPGTPTLSDVSSSNVFFVSIETSYAHGVINGYPDHTFRPNNNIRRDEMAQIVFKAVTTP
jgi:S-layer homology domain